MRLNTAIYVYRSLLRECRHQFERYGLDSISIRAPINSMPGSFNSKATAGAEYQLETLQTLIPGLAVLPQEQQLPLTLSSMRQLVKDNFKANSALKQQDSSIGGGSSNQEFSALDQGFAALRALQQLAYSEACSSRAETDGVVIEATSCFSPLDTYPRQTAGAANGEHWFKYRIRITNTRQYPVKVLGRGWVIKNHADELEGYVMLTPVNAIVGQQPTIPPGGCFEYVSCTPLRNALGPGEMQGKFMVDLLGPAYDGPEEEQQAAAEDELTELERVQVPVAPFKLQTMQLAAQTIAAKHRQDQSNSSSMASDSSSSTQRTADSKTAPSSTDVSSSSEDDSEKP